jgi:hypothetical protein
MTVRGQTAVVSSAGASTPNLIWVPAGIRDNTVGEKMLKFRNSAPKLNAYQRSLVPRNFNHDDGSASEYERDTVLYRAPESE